jgi:hypothetical protein
MPYADFIAVGRISRSNAAGKNFIGATSAEVGSCSLSMATELRLL